MKLAFILNKINIINLIILENKAFRLSQLKENNRIKKKQQKKTVGN